MENFKPFIIVSLIIGITAGAALSHSLSTTKCDKVEQALEESSNSSVAVACFEPSFVNREVPEKVEETSEKECVCRKSFNGYVEYLTINRANP